MKKVRDTWTTGIMEQQLWTPSGMVPANGGDWLRLIINHVSRKKFKVGDRVRVTVTLLKRDKRNAEAEREGK